MAIGRIPEPGTGIPESIIAAKGDILTGTANDTPAVLTVGTDETRLVADSGETTGLKYVADTTNYAVAAKGDLLVGTAADTLAALTVGTDGHTLVADSVEATGLKWAAPAGGGKVLQVISTTKDDTFTTASSTFVDITGLSVSITPASASNKILVLFNLSAAQDYNVSIAQARLMRDSTPISVGATAGSRTSSTSDPLTTTNVIIGTTVSGSFLDNPATTSALTYKFQLQSHFGTSYVNRTEQDQSQVSRSRTASTITVLEIGA
jgi:hypothetical protein